MNLNNDQIRRVTISMNGDSLIDVYSGVVKKNRFKNFVNQSKTTNPERIRRAHMLESKVDNHEACLQVTEHQLKQRAN